jgi:DNA polymerase
MQDSLEQIKIDLKKFDKLEICKSCIQPVPGRGNSNATIMLIGEAPGAQEDKLGLPFIGRSGNLLEQLLQEANIDLSTVYITNIVKFRPPNNRDPKPKEKEACLEFLIREIQVIKPKIIATLGRHSMNFFLPKGQISELHGQKLILNSQWNPHQIFFPLYHPAVALYNPNMKKVLFEDIKKLAHTITNEL